jgi:hypothetical protein
MGHFSFLDQKASHPSPLPTSWGERERWRGISFFFFPLSLEKKAE